MLSIDDCGVVAFESCGKGAQLAEVIGLYRGDPVVEALIVRPVIICTEAVTWPAGPRELTPMLDTELNDFQWRRRKQV
jgi:hypothetical protein